VSRDSCNFYDFYRAEQQVETGRRAAREVLDKL
ncbi:MAG: alpha/beta hydrolase, partial [Bacteroidetes bacterium]